MFEVHLIITSWFIFSKMSSLVRRFITASSKDQSSNKPLFKQIGPILKHFKQCQCQPVKFFFSLRFDLSWETSDWRQANGRQTVFEENPTKYEVITRRYILPSPPPPPPHTHTHTKHTHARTKRPRPVIQVSLPETYILPGIFGLFINFCSLLMDH